MDDKKNIDRFILSGSSPTTAKSNQQNYLLLGIPFMDRFGNQLKQVISVVSIDYVAPCLREEDKREKTKLLYKGQLGT